VAELPAVVSVVAKSGTGKTTLLEALIPHLKTRGLRIGLLKHHSHLSSFDTPGKDTHRLAEAGADVVVGASPVQVAMFRREPGSTDLDEVIAQHLWDTDLVLTEGYKRGPYPKVEVHRSVRSDELLCSPEEMLALVTDREWPIPVPQFSLDDTAGLADLLLAWHAGLPPRSSPIVSPSVLPPRPAKTTYLRHRSQEPSPRESPRNERLHSNPASETVDSGFKGSN
jgi:molybdopterin-guanine dinucleotide biosynthesis protein MobB